MALPVSVHSSYLAAPVLYMLGTLLSWSMCTGLLAETKSEWAVQLTPVMSRVLGQQLRLDVGMFAEHAMKWQCSICH